jgi:hypothetical protein
LAGASHRRLAIKHGVAQSTITRAAGGDTFAHVPVLSIALVGAGSIVALYLYVYTTFFATLTGIFGSS